MVTNLMNKDVRSGTEIFEEMISKMKKSMCQSSIKLGYSKLHKLYVEYSKEKYPKNSIVKQEVCRRKLKKLDESNKINHIIDGKRIYYEIDLTEELLAIKGIKDIFESWQNPVVKKVDVINEFLFNECANSTDSDSGYTINQLFMIFNSWNKDKYPDNKPIKFNTFQNRLWTISKEGYINSEYTTVTENNSPRKRNIYKVTCSNSDIKPFKINKEGEVKMNNYCKFYKESDRKFESKNYHGDTGTIEKFLYDNQYSMVFSKNEYIRYTDLFKDYIDYCNKSVYVPVSINTFRKFLEESTYQVKRIKSDEKFLYVNINNKKKKFIKTEEINQQISLDVLPDIPTEDIQFDYKTHDIETSVKVVGEYHFLPISKPDKNDQANINKEVRQFLSFNCQYDMEQEYDTRKLYAAFLYYTKSNDVSFNDFRYILSSTPVAKLNTSDTTETVCVLPEFEYLEKMKTNFGNVRISNFEKRVAEPKKEIFKIFQDLEEHNFLMKNEETKKEEEKIEEPAQPVPVVEEVSVNKTYLDLDNVSMETIDKGLQEIESKYSVIITKYSTMKELKELVKSYRPKVHGDLKAVFDLYVSMCVNKLKEADTEEKIKTEFVICKSKLYNLTLFVKKDDK